MSNLYMCTTNFSCERQKESEEKSIIMMMREKVKKNIPSLSGRDVCVNTKRVGIHN